MRRFQFLTAIVLVAALFTLATGAEAQETTASIRGTIVDAAGSPLAAAKVEVLDTRTGNIRSFTSNDDGVFLATRLSPGGPYILIVNDQETVEVENLSEMYCKLLAIGEPRVLDSEEMARVLERFRGYGPAQGGKGT